MSSLKVRQIEQKVDLEFMSGMCDKVLAILSRESEIYHKPSVAISFVKKELSVNYKFLTEVMRNLSHKKMIMLFLRDGADQKLYDCDDVMINITEDGLNEARRVLYKSAGLHIA